MFENTDEGIISSKTGEASFFSLKNSERLSYTAILLKTWIPLIHLFRQ